MNSTTIELLSNDQMRAISVISLVTSCLSFIGSGSVFFCAIYHGRVCYPEIFPTFHLSLADMLSSFFLLIGSSVFLKNMVIHDINFPGSPGPCGYIMTIVTCSYTIAFFLTITYALEALFRFRRRLTDGMNLDLMAVQAVSNKWMYLAYSLAWLVPVVLAVVLMLVTGNLRDKDDSAALEPIPTPIITDQCSSCFAVFWFNEDDCWVQVDEGQMWHTAIKLMFLIPLMLVLILNMILYVLITKVFKQVAMRRGLLSYHQRQEESLLKKKAMLYQGVFFFCWLPTIVLGVLSFTSDYLMGKFYWLLVVQAVAGPLQGIFNSIIYGWKRDSFRRALSERTSLLSTNRTTAMAK
ncbi:uncharacterized protein LOC131953395 isoform X2 [Physella acuta]|uniref:uncharacterized protein LOC131953395 isoform X2 n=1 Tax=Physella acuta TaxID=109671 RepID=UPI0027DD6EC5|nr:uncharacterized protein LOC131953395 isoform X2 [Physella acuta]XP_059172538.1 uncharacterized protein LOC131953395 isoform X2 [Physella acuta]